VLQKFKFKFLIWRSYPKLKIKTVLPWGMIPYEVIWKTLIRTKLHQVLFQSLQLAKVMAIPNYEIWVLQNFGSKKFQISKFWVCNFLTITKRHLSLEHISTLNWIFLCFSSIMFFSKFEIWKFYWRNFKFPNSKNGMHQVGQKVNFPENFSFLAFMTTELASRQIFQQSYGHYWLFSRVFVKFSSRNFRNLVWGHMEDFK
jgi:hypothetical protein